MIVALFTIPISATITVWKAQTIKFMSVQTYTKVSWDDTLIDVEFTDTDTCPTAMAGLVKYAVKTTTGAPTATAGKFIPGAVIANGVDGTQYQNTGTTASPVFEVVQTATSVESFKIAFAGTASGGTTATRAYTITGALATDIVTAVIRASTNAAAIQKATLSADTLTVLFSTDPGAGTTVDYQIVRPT